MELLRGTPHRCIVKLDQARQLAATSMRRKASEFQNSQNEFYLWFESILKAYIYKEQVSCPV